MASLRLTSLAKTSISAYLHEVHAESHTFANISLLAVPCDHTAWRFLISMELVPLSLSLVLSLEAEVLSPAEV